MRSGWRAAGAAYAPIDRRTVSVEQSPWKKTWFNPRALLLTRGSDRPVPPPGDRTRDRREPLPGVKVERLVNGRAAADKVRLATPWWLGAIAAGAVLAGLIGGRLRRRRDDRTDDGVPRVPSPRDRVVRAARPWLWGLAGVGAVALLGGTGRLLSEGDVPRRGPPRRRRAVAAPHAVGRRGTRRPACGPGRPVREGVRLPSPPVPAGRDAVRHPPVGRAGRPLPSHPAGGQRGPGIGRPGAGGGGRRRRTCRGSCCWRRRGPRRACGGPGGRGGTRELRPLRSPLHRRGRWRHAADRPASRDEPPRAHVPPRPGTPRPQRAASPLGRSSRRRSAG